MLRKILIAIGVLIVVVIILIVVAGIVVMRIVDKPFVESRISQALNRQVKIEKIDVSIFSIVSGIEIKNMVISNFKTPSELFAMKDKPVAAGDNPDGRKCFRSPARRRAAIRLVRPWPIRRA